jgi:hypothetical protein
MNDRLIRELLARVRARWRRLIALNAIVRAALLTSVVLAAALLVMRSTGRHPRALAVVAAVSGAMLVAAVVRGLWPARERPSDRRVARFIEEAEPSLDDRLATAVDADAARVESSPIREAMIADAARRASAIDPTQVVAESRLRRATVQAAAAVLILLGIGFLGRAGLRQSLDALAYTLFPERLHLDVIPGNVRLHAGEPLTIEARLAGNSAPVVAELLRDDGAGREGQWPATPMRADTSGAFRIQLNSIGSSFKYRVRAGTVTSTAYDVVVVRPPRVTRIDVDYAFPKELGIAARTEQDGGDIYAPAGTNVTVKVHTDRIVASADLQRVHADPIHLTGDARDTSTVSGTFTVSGDDSYRIALADLEGMKSPGDTEYFIRMLNDRPPDVHIVRPARDRTVTRLEEVDVEAQADDDFGVASMDLVYSVRGGPEKVAPIEIPARAASVSGKRTLYLEDLDVAPGDFISYYVRARDVSRGKQSSESRSDLFFLEVRPFDQEFTMATSQGAGGGDRSLDDLVQAQKDVIVSTWKLDRRSLTSGGAKSADDIRSVAKAESELKTRVEETSSGFRVSTMRDPRQRPQPGRGGRTPPAPIVGQPTAEEDDMTAAARAMGTAAETLNDLRTKDAIDPEMEALNRLLKAQADDKKRQLSVQQAGSGTGSNRSNVDMSSLFDRELRRQQQTNYENRQNATEERRDSSLLDKVRDLAKRQDELSRQQQELARKRDDLNEDELKRQLEQLTRDQSDLRQRAEDLAQQLSQQQQSGAQSGTMRSASDAMRNASNNLRQQNPGQAGQQSSQAADALHKLERQMQQSSPDERRRALGDAQLEAQQLADAQRRIASELSQAGQNSASSSKQAGKQAGKQDGNQDGEQQARDALRRLAGEEERLASRTSQLQQTLKDQGSQGQPDKNAARDQAVSAAAREFAERRVPDAMKDASDAMRAASDQAGRGSPGAQDDTLQASASKQQELAKALDRLADKLASAGSAGDAESQKLSNERARAQELRDRIDKLTSDLERAAQQAQTGGRADGRSGRGDQVGGRGSATNLDQMRQEYARELQEARDLLDEMRREDPTLAQGGIGFTFEGQGMTMSAPGTEAFKQDFAKWNQLRVQATAALERAETAISKRLDQKAAHDRLAAGADERVPAPYDAQVDRYFKALADRKE